MRRYSMELHPIKPWEAVLGLLVGIGVPLTVFVAVVWGFMALFR